MGKIVKTRSRICEASNKLLGIRKKGKAKKRSKSESQKTHEHIYGRSLKSSIKREQNEKKLNSNSVESPNHIANDSISMRSRFDEKVIS